MSQDVHPLRGLVNHVLSNVLINLLCFTKYIQIFLVTSFNCNGLEPSAFQSLPSRSTIISAEQCANKRHDYAPLTTPSLQTNGIFCLISSGK